MHFLRVVEWGRRKAKKRTKWKNIMFSKNIPYLNNIRQKFANQWIKEDYKRIMYNFPMQNRIWSITKFDQNKAKCKYEWFWTLSLLKSLNMVLMVDGNSEHVAHAWRKIGKRIKTPICNCSRSNKCLKIKSQRLFLTRAPISEIPSHISTILVWKGPNLIKFSWQSMCLRAEGCGSALP